MTNPTEESNCQFTPCCEDSPPAFVITYSISPMQFQVCNSCIQLDQYSRGILSKKPITELESDTTSVSSPATEKLESQIKDTKQSLILCEYCLKGKGRSRRFKNLHHLNYHKTWEHSKKSEIGFMEELS